MWTSELTDDMKIKKCFLLSELPLLVQLCNIVLQVEKNIHASSVMITSLADLSVVSKKAGETEYMTDVWP